MYRDYLIKMLELPQDNEIKWQTTVNTNQFYSFYPIKLIIFPPPLHLKIMISAQFRMAIYPSVRTNYPSLYPQYILIILHSTLSTPLF